MYCSNCGNEVPDANLFCGKCGREMGPRVLVVEQPKKSGASPVFIILFVLLGGIALVLILGNISTASRGQNSNPVFQAMFRHESRPLYTGSHVIEPMHYQSLKFVITPQMKNARVSGRFQATGGSGNDLKALLTDEDGFLNYQNNHQARSYYSSGKVTADSIDVRLAPGTYYLVFDNSFSVISNKAFEANVNLEYDRSF
jgi:hypothetical protein